MALPTIQHFTHPQHPITLQDDAINPNYLCEGCKTYGSGKRYHCHICAFNLHEYCGTCPQILWSFMHPSHSLTLVGRDHLPEHVCKICRDPIERLSYGCKLCEFHVHPICSQLPGTLNHILHQQHPLRLLGSFEPAGSCAVCRQACDAFSWRYRCAPCGFDIHIECVPVQCEKRMTDRGIPTYGLPSVQFPQQQYFGGDTYWHPSPNPFPSPSYMHHYNPFPGPSNMLHYNPFPGPSNMHHYNPFPGPSNMPHPQLYQQHQVHGPAQNHQGGSGGQIGQKMFNLVKALGIGVISNAIFGGVVSPFFAS